MKLGLHIPATSWAGGPERLGSTLAQVVEVAEAAGFDAIDVGDHVWQHPMMGGPTGERRTLPLVARYADACNLRPSPEIPRQLDLKRRLSEQAGRDYETIEKTAAFDFDVGKQGENAPEVIGNLRWLAGLGIETVFGWVVGVDRITPLEVMAREVIPAAAELRSQSGATAA
jgi:hypothetical protein